MPPQDANPTPSFGGFGIRGPPVQELRLREFNFDHQFDEIEIRQLVAAAILSIHKERGIISPSNLVHPEACAVQVGSRHVQHGNMSVAALGREYS